METHRQRCQNCQSARLMNILVREPGSPPTVFARCVACGELVARYTLEDYYHHGKGIESYLRSHGGAAADSGRGLMKDFQSIEADVLEAYESALAHLREEGKDLD